MDEIGTRELRDHLSRYLRKLQTGKTYTITSHGKPVGQLIPFNPDIIDKDLQKLLSSGKARWNGSKPRGASVEIKKGPPVSDYVIEDRR